MSQLSGGSSQHPEVDFWFDFASPYSYIAAERIDVEASRRQAKVNWKPFLWGRVFSDEYGPGDSPFQLHPARGQYMWRDVDRLCFKYGIPFIKPSAFPRNGLLASWVVSFAAEASWIPAFVRSVFRTNFLEDRDISDPARLREILEGLGQDGEEILARAQDQETQELLRKRNAEAKVLGIFGAPDFSVSGELFWGQDRMDDALDWAQVASAAG